MRTCTGPEVLDHLMARLWSYLPGMGCPPVPVIQPAAEAWVHPPSGYRCSGLPAFSPVALMRFSCPCRGSGQPLAGVPSGLQQGTLPSKILSIKHDGISLTGNTTFSVVKFPNTNANRNSCSHVNINGHHPAPAGSRKVLDC